MARMTNPADASHAALADAVLEEASQRPGQTAHSAVVRAAVKANVLQNTLRKRYNNRVPPKFRRAATLCLRKVLRQDTGGRPRKVDNAALTSLVRGFLLRHSKETSRFCRTKKKTPEGAPRPESKNFEKRSPKKDTSNTSPVRAPKKHDFGLGLPICPKLKSYEPPSIWPIP